MAAAAMSPPTPALDLFVLTFNCAKATINTGVFANHLATALRRRPPQHDPDAEAGLPDLVVFSLQEASPLSYAFIGPYFLRPYLARFEEALNMAAARVLDADGAADAAGGQRGDDAADDDSSRVRGPGSGEQDGEEATQALLGRQRQYYDQEDQETAHRKLQQQQTKPYMLVRGHNVGMTAILLFARDPAAVRRADVAECGFGAADMGNKGAVGLRVAYDARRQRRQGGGGEEVEEEEEEEKGITEFTFVAAHLAAMEWNCAKRNANWRAIVSGLTFANPRDVLPGVFPADTAAPLPDRSGRGELRPPSSSAGGGGGEGVGGRLAGGQEIEEREEGGDDDEYWEQVEGGGHRGGHRRSAGSRDNTSLGSEAAQPLLPTNRGASRRALGDDAASASAEALTLAQKAALHDLSIFKPSAAYLFVAGDLNYRTSSRPPPLPASGGGGGATDIFPPAADHHPLDTTDRQRQQQQCSQLLARDQLAQERAAGRTFHGLAEAPIAFGPTYKYTVLPPAARGGERGTRAGRDEEEEQEEDISWRWSRHRWPSWCDRVLYMGLPPLMAGGHDATATARDQQGGGGPGSTSTSSKSEEHPGAVEVLAYDSLPVVRTSDHRAVFFRARVPLVGKVRVPPSSLSSLPQPPTQQTRPSQDQGGGPLSSAAAEDPRVVLPFPVDVHTWERRAAARRREVAVGWSALLLSTREGAALLVGTAMLLTGVVWFAWGGGS